jgi:hypothetical protein
MLARKMLSLSDSVFKQKFSVSEDFGAGELGSKMSNSTYKLPVYCCRDFCC